MKDREEREFNSKAGSAPEPEIVLWSPDPAWEDIHSNPYDRNVRRSVVGSYFHGVGQGLINLGEGFRTGEVLEGLILYAQDPIGTTISTGISMAEDFEENVIDGDRYTAAEYFGETTFYVVVSVFGPKVTRNAKKGTPKVNRTFEEMLNDIENNPGDWVKTKENVTTSTKKGNKGGLSIEEEYTNKKTGEKIYKHILKDKEGRNVEAPHYRPYPKQIK